ncbi:hypothetical protein GCM10010211_61790 [Streptomyces albospinus]|uniref:Uncharacterized protein n=1 Tax=Streptomyces albospinus TaxID=285515 RepID=A0ABQ2VIC7_9ACTN|nr:hypothetical protein GCM10010211_61790 [Streptomyces albospinus]
MPEGLTPVLAGIGPAGSDSVQGFAAGLVGAIALFVIGCGPGWIVGALNSHRGNPRPRCTARPAPRGPFGEGADVRREGQGPQPEFGRQVGHRPGGLTQTRLS